MKKTNDKKSFIVLGVVIIIILIVIQLITTNITFSTINRVEQEQENYYNQVEALLDSICNHNEDYFHDTLMETDVYYNYEVARDQLNKQYKH